MKIFGCHGNELPIKEILYQSVFGDKYYMIGHKFTISVTMDESPFAWCLARAVLKLWYLIVLIPDLCRFSYFFTFNGKIEQKLGSMLILFIFV